MKQEELQRVVPGFNDPVMGSQAVFRCALQALALPGRPVDIPEAAQLPTKGHRSAAMVLLALLDSDCAVWLSPSLRDSDTRAWLRFHTGCRCVDDPAQAGFLWLAEGDAWPPLALMDAGSDHYPDQSATCVMEVAAFEGEDASSWHLDGPGIDGSRRLATRGLPMDFEQQWSANHAGFPRGVDVFLAAPAQLVGLPRSTRLSRADVVEV
jgi:alpha-D-ribose 1-methylphosphonate 5-triphosphate synthase subunit PhnH